jgi:hypothetical protein
MNLTCPTCQKTLNCSNCDKPPINNQTNNNGTFKEITGTLQRELGTKTDKNGNIFYFGKLELEDGGEQIVFFFQPDYELTAKLDALSGGDQIKVSGTLKQNGFFTAKELLEINVSERTEIF